MAHFFFRTPKNRGWELRGFSLSGSELWWLFKFGLKLAVVLLCLAGAYYLIAPFFSGSSGGNTQSQNKPVPVQAPSPPAIRSAPPSSPVVMQSLPGETSVPALPKAESVPASTDSKTKSIADDDPKEESKQLTIDESYKILLKTKCDGSILCGEKLRWKLCKGKWSPEPPPGQTICVGASATGN